MQVNTTVELTDEQQHARALIQDQIDRREPGFFTMHGLAGSGKTTVLSAVARENPRAVVCTLTGKAADVLRRKMGRGDTIHSVFYLLQEESYDSTGRQNLKFVPVLEPDSMRGHVVLLDECSMINEKTARDILRTGCTVIACGDPGQLHRLLAVELQGVAGEDGGDQALPPLRQAVQGAVVLTGRDGEGRAEHAGQSRPGQTPP